MNILYKDEAVSSDKRGVKRVMNIAVMQLYFIVLIIF